jgi:hypothetical protein
MALSDDAEELSGILGEVQAAMEAARKSGMGMADGMSASKEALSGLVGAAKQFKEYQKDSTNTSYEQLKALQEKFKVEKENLSLAQQALRAQQDLASKQKSANENLIKALKSKKGLEEGEKVVLQELLNKNKELKQSIAEQGIQMAQNDKILKDFDGSVQQLEGDLDKAAKKAKGLSIFSNVMDGLGKALDKVQTPLDGFLSPLALFTKLLSFGFDTIVAFDKRVGETAKSMNMTVDAVDKSNRAMITFAKSSGDAYANAEGLNRVTTELNKNLGTSVAFEKMGAALQEDVNLMSQLEDVAGLTAEESQGILKYSMGTGQSAKNVTKELMASYKVQGLKSGLVLNEKDAMRDIAKTSKATQLSYGGNAKELGKALAAAKGLGVELSKVEGISDSILNFEQSIEDELSAELLTGKDLNLEKARQAALNNDMATVAEEITKQAGSAAEFTKMNRIQQEAMAKAVGMNREELAGALMEQEALKNIGAESIEQAREQYDLAVKNGTEKEFLKKLGDEALGNQLEQATMAEKKEIAEKQMADTLIKSLPSIKTMSEGFTKILDTVKFIFDKLGGAKGLMVIMGALIAGKMVKGIIDFAKGTKEIYDVTKRLFTAKKAEAGVEVVSSSYQMASKLGPAGIIAVAGLIGAGIGALATYAMSDGIIPPSGKSGFGDRVMFGPEGAISFNNKDTIVAGTDLFANDAVMEPGKATQTGNQGEIKIKSEGGGGQDMTRSQFNSSMVAAITALASRPIHTSVQLDGKELATMQGKYPNEAGDANGQVAYQMS